MSQFLIVTPGRLVSTEEEFMRRHGTISVNGSLNVTVAGVVEKINKLFCVTPLKSGYFGNIQQRQGRGNGKSMLVRTDIRLFGFLSGGIQRIKHESNERQMQSFFSDDKLVCDEVQLLYQNDSIHIRYKRITLN